MRKFSFLLTLALAIGLIAATTPNGSEKAMVDTEKSKLEWKGYKVTGSHTGYVNIKEGSLDFEDGALVGGEFTIDMASITVTDLTGDYKGKLEGHLKSDDFFGVKKHPTASFKIKEVVSRGKPGEYKITGALTIKEITQEIKFNAMVKEDGNMVKATGDMEIDRSDFNVRYGSGSFFDGLGDKTIYDEFDLSVSLVAAK